MKLFVIALYYGLGLEALFEAKPVPKRNTRLETYFKYLQYLESDYIPVTDVMNIYRINPGGMKIKTL